MHEKAKHSVRRSVPHCFHLDSLLNYEGWVTTLLNWAILVKKIKLQNQVGNFVNVIQRFWGVSNYVILLTAAGMM